MYNVKGPSKIVAKTTRRGMSQNIDSLRDHSRSKFLECEDSEVLNGPKPIFQSISRKSPGSIKQKTDITPQHQEIIKYVNESWNSVCNEMVLSPSSNGRESPRSDQSIIYYEDDPCPMLQNFKPFDLESWWGKRLFTSITNSVNSNS